MKEYKIAIYFMISGIVLAVSIGFLVGALEAKTAFPIIFVLLGCQQIFHGFLMVPKAQTKLKKWSLIAGTFFLLFAVGVVIPSYLQ